MSDAAPVRVGLIDVDALAPYARNARVHHDESVARLVKIIESVGWTNPILMDGDGIVAGHKRRLAALAIYAGGGVIRLPDGEAIPPRTVPYIDVSGWTEEQRRAYIIADNATTFDSEWDLGALRLEIDWLRDAGADMDLTGFSADGLAAALGSPEAAPPAVDPLRVKLADRFLIPPFSVLSAREGWWQDRKRAWLALGIRSELGRGEGDHGAAPGGSMAPLDRAKAAAAAERASPGGGRMPAANYSKSKARGDGRGREA